MSADVIQSLSPARQTDERPDFLPVSPKHSPSHSRRRSSGNNTVATNGGVRISADSGNGQKHKVVVSDVRSIERERNEKDKGQNGGCSLSGSLKSEAAACVKDDGTDGSGSNNGTTDVGKFPTDDVIGATSAPPPQNGIFKMLFKRKLQVLLTAIAAKNAFYSGLEVPISSSPSSDDCSLGEGPSSFSPFEGTPNSQPPSLKTATSLESPFYQLCNVVAKDGKTGNQEASSQKRGVWTLNLLDGKLFLFKTDPKSESDRPDGNEGEGEGEGEKEREGEVEGEGEGEGEEIVEGIELSKLLAKTPKSPASHGGYYFHLPYTVMYAEWQDPHVSPVYTYPDDCKYRLYKRQDSKMTPTEFILYHGTVFLVLEEEGSSGPIINAVHQDEMIARLKQLAKEGKTSEAPQMVVNIIWESKKPSPPPSNPNNIAIYFTGKERKYHYYVHVGDDGKLEPVRCEIAKEPAENWRNHMEFCSYYTTPFMVDAAVGGRNEQGRPHGNGDLGNGGKPIARKLGETGRDTAKTVDVDAKEGVANGKDH